MTGWIVIPGWEKFQHRDAGRSGRGLTWLRDYADQGNKDEYRDLTFHLRGLLRDIRHAYAMSQGQLRMDTTSLGRRFGQRVFKRDIERLVDAGFIEVSASKPPALSQQTAGLEVEVEVKPLPLSISPAKPTSKPATNGHSRTCPICGITVAPPTLVLDHMRQQHETVAA